MSFYKEYLSISESYRPGIDLRIKTKEDVIKDINLLITVIKEKDSIKGYIFTFRDITYELIQKKQVNEYTKKLLIYSNIDHIFIKYTPPVLYEELLKYIMEITNSKDGLIGFLDDEKDFNVVAMSGYVNVKCKIRDKIDFKNYINSGSIWVRTIKTGEVHILNETKVPEGHIRIRNVASFPLKYSDKTMGVIMLANRDNEFTLNDVEFFNELSSYISQRIYYIIQNENLLKEREERLMDEFEAKSMESLLSLTGGLAHDFNNLLLPVTTNISLFKEKFKENEEISEDLKEIDEYINAAQSLAKQLLSISNPKTQGIEKVNVKQLIETSVEFVGRGLLVKIDLEIDESIRNLEMFLPKNQIIQVLTNIILNSAQALSNSTNPKIIVRSYIKDNNLFIEIEDNGPGIKEEYRDLLFKPYFTTKKEGRGLGLFMSYSIVKNLGGDIDFETEEGKGTKFIIQIPVKQKVQDSELKSINVETEKEDEFSGINALIIDDEKFVLKSFSKLMKFFKVNVFTAENSQEAIDIINNNNIDILVVDLMLKGDVKGNELNKKIKEIKKDIFSVASSGYTDDDTIMHFKKYHFDYVLPKPYRIDDIKKMLSFYKSYKRNSV